jgi:hypothetical protein
MHILAELTFVITHSLLKKIILFQCVAAWDLILNHSQAPSLNDIDDVKYMRDKLFAAIKIPQSYLTNLEGADEDKTTLAQKDIRFARTIQRLQRSIRF